MTTLKTNCNGCGAELEAEMPEGVIGETCLLSMWENSVICDRCYNRQQAERNKKTKNQLWEELKEQATIAGLPLGLLSWDKAKGNNELLNKVYQLRDRSLFVAGVNRVGKTRSVVRTAALALWHHGIEGKELFYTTMPQLRKTVSRLARSDDSDAEENFYKKLSYKNLLIIDDLDKGVMTDAGLESLWRIVDDRIVNGKMLWVTANEGGDGLEKIWTHKNEHRTETARAIRTRLAEICTPIPVDETK